MRLLEPSALTLARPERSAERVVEGRLARPLCQRPSTQFILSDAAGGVEGLRTSEVWQLA